MHQNQRWVIASSNVGKLKEYASLLQPLSVELVAQGSLGIDDAIEDGLSFIENALIKARHAAAASGLPAIADDSGLAVAALDGAPGIFSARYAAAGSAKPTDAANIEKLLTAMADETNRDATFVCVIAALRHAKDPTPLICQGYWQGQLLQQPEGDAGFGYDPIFWVPERNCSAAALSPADKNQLSHRGKAANDLLRQLHYWP